MNFSPLNIRELKFHRGLFGFRSRDVEDFMRHVAEDYEFFQLKEIEASGQTDEIEKLKDINASSKAIIQQLNKKIEQLEAENKQLKTYEKQIESLEVMKQLAQKTADTVQQEANLLLEAARKEADKLIQEAEAGKMNRLLNLQIKLDDLTKKQEQIDRQITNKRKEYFELESECEELFALKSRYSEEAQVLKQEFLALKSNLVDRYEKSLEEFIEENPLFKQIESEEPLNKVMTLKTKKIG